jgi:DNA polymerase III subunit beta
MKAVISKSDLVMLISKIQSIVSNKPAIPILANVLIEAIDDQLILSATDLTTSMKCYTEAKVIEEGAIALPARRFFQLIRELTSPQVKLSSHTDEIAEITSGSSVFKINGMNKSEFPTLPDIGGATQIAIKPTELKGILSKVAFAATKEDSRYVLNGILLKIVDQNATFICTDGKRLARVSLPVDIDKSFQGTYILPLKAVEEMVKILDENREYSHLSLMRDKVFLEHGNHILTTKLMAGQYPDVERVIPETTNCTISLHREELITLLKQISLFTSDTNTSVRFNFQDSQLSLNANSSDIGEGNVSMPVDYSGEALEIAFNPHYFQDILQHSKDETVSFAIQDSYNPGVITDTTTALFVIMPMRLSETYSEPSNNETDDSEKPAFT